MKKKERVLCVIADIIKCNQKMVALRAAGFKVTHVTTASEAEAELAKQSFDALVCEQHLNTRDAGLTFARKTVTKRRFLSFVVILEKPYVDGFNPTPTPEDARIFFTDKSESPRDFVDLTMSALAKPEMLV